MRSGMGASPGAGRENLRADLGPGRIDFRPEWADFVPESKFWI